MARGATTALSEYELERQERIAKNQALLRSLALDAAGAGLAPTKSRSATPAKSQKKKSAAKREKVEVVPLRTSSRLRGIVADSEVAKRKAEDEHEALRAAEQAKRQRVSGDLNLGDIVVGGQWDKAGNFLTGVGPARPYERTFSAQDVKETSDKELKALREKMSGLKLWEGFEPNRIKITPERIYSLGFHPTQDKALVFAGDKLGNLGILDASQSIPESREDDEEEINDEDPVISTFKLHTRTISSFQFSPSEPNSLYTASYDASIRRLDLAKGVAVEVWGPADKSDDEPISGVEISRTDPNMLYFTTLAGKFGIHDMRQPSIKTEMLQLSEKKIGGFTLHPAYSHLVATASLDRMLKIWDLRKISGKGDWRLPALVGEHESRLSVSHASFNSAGQVATASYDDTVKIHDFSNCGDWKVGTSLTDAQMKPATIIPHNNQTGRWVTM